MPMFHAKFLSRAKYTVVSLNVSHRTSLIRSNCARVQETNVGAWGAQVLDNTSLLGNFFKGLEGLLVKN